MKAKTFIANEPSVEVTVVDRIGTTNNFRVEYQGTVYARHRDRLQPLDEETRKFIGK